MTYRLTREPPGEDVHLRGAFPEFVYVVEDRDVRPVFREHALTVRVTLAEPRGAEVPRHFQPEVNPTDACEEAPHCPGAIAHPLPFSREKNRGRCGRCE